MKCVAVVIAAAVPLLVGGPAGAATRVPSFILVAAANSDTAAERDSYRRKAMDEMRQWQRRLQDAGATAAAKGKVANEAARKDLDKAWADAKTASERLRAASAEAWSHARVTYEKATRNLAAAWRRFHGEEK